MSREDYERGLADGTDGKPPDYDSLALGSNHMNDYERGYVQSGASAVVKIRKEDAK